MIAKNEVKILRDLAKEVLELSMLPCNMEKKKKWTELNDIEKGKIPLFMTHLWEISTKEIFSEASYKCSSPEARYYENYLMSRIFFAKEIRDDNVVEPVIYYKADAWIENFPKLQVQKKWANDEMAGAHAFLPSINEYSDMEKITDPVLHYNEKQTLENCERAADIFEPILTVIKEPFYFAAKVIDEFSWLRGIEQTYIDMAEEPEWMHQVLQLITKNIVKRFKLLEDVGLWGCADKSYPLGSAGLRYVSGMKDWSTAEDPHTFSPKLNDSWGFTCAEVCNCVSNSMHDDFSFTYDKQIMNMFKYINVGCCETLDSKIELVKSLSNTRKVSISEWCDVEKAAKNIGTNYLYSYRAAGVPFIEDPWDIEASEKEIKGVIKATKECGCPLEIVLNIGGTFGKGDPRLKLLQWTDMVRKLIEKYA